ncbi:MAG: PAS/PAC sensor signal transduction histidine [Geobacteraceae bacterium]|nr:MAG: PAS/PAC sensor signal transduction histidine [Geobacteraceae bacterium]
MFEKTEHKEVELALRESEERFRATFDQAAVGMAHVDLEGRWLRANRKMCDIVGYTEEELRNLTFKEITYIDDIAPSVENFQRALADEVRSYSLEKRYLHKNGSSVWANVTVSLVRKNPGNPAYFIVVVEDIAARKLAEEALQESEALFRIIFEQASQLMGLMKPDGTLIKMNRSAAELIKAREPEKIGKSFPLRMLEPIITHAKDTQREVLGKPFWETPWWTHSTELQEQLRDAVRRASQGEEVRFEATHKTPEGKLVWVDFSLTPVKDENDNVVLLVPEGRDITVRKMAEEALRESEEKFSKAFLAVPSLLIIVTLPYEKYVEVNEAFEQACGYRQGEVFGRTMAEVDFWENPADRTRVIRTLQEQGRLRDLEMGFRNRSGGLFVGLLSAELIDLCGVTCMVCIITDITERKRAEEALRRSEEKFAKVFRYAPSLLVVSSTLEEGRLIEVNEAFEKAFKYKRDEVIGSSAIDLNIWVNPDDRVWVIQTLREKGEVRDREISFRDRSGEVFVGLYSATIIEIGGEECLLSILNDITARKRMEEQIETLHTNLSSRAAELETANAELEAFGYTVSHDLRKPLTNINGYCQVVLELCGSNLDDRCRGYLREIYDGTLRMAKLIEALLNFSHLTRGELHRETVDLSGMARAIAAELSLSEPGRGVEFRIAEGITVNGDANLLRVVLENLLGNAWKYTGKRKEAVIGFGRVEAEGKPVYFVRDNGAGFDMRYADNLFTPFHRLHGADEFKGHGIGLATVQRIIQRHGGRIWAEGEPGRGATFFFSLP